MSSTLGRVSAQLSNAYVDRLAAGRASRSDGSVTVGLVGNTVPPEIVMAAGGVPVLISASAGSEGGSSSRYVDDELERETRCLVELAFSGSLDFLDLLVIPSTSEAHIYTFQFVKQFFHMGMAAAIPPAYLCDLLYDGTARSEEFSRAQLAALLRRLEVTSGHAASTADLHESASRVGALRTAVCRVLDRRDRGQLLGSETVVAIAGALSLGVVAGPPALESWLDGLDEAAPGQGRARILLFSSVPLDHSEVHLAVEEAGGTVVAEDDWWGSRYAAEDLDLSAPDLLEEIFQYYRRAVPSPAMSHELRYAWLRQQARRPDIDAVVFYVPPEDQSFGWDYPELEREIAAGGTATVLVRQDVLTPSSRDGAVNSMRAFISSLRPTPIHTGTTGGRP